MNIFTLNLIYYLLDISIFLFIVCTFLYSKNWSKSGSAHKTLAVYFGFIAILQLTIRLFFDFSKNNWIISNIFLIGEFAISSFLFFILLKRKIFRNIIKIIVCFFVTITIIQYADDYMIFFKINALSSSIVSISIILYSVFYLYEILDQKKMYYYVTIGIIIFQFGSIFLFLIGNLYLQKYPEVGLIPYMFHIFLTFIYTFFVFLEWKINFSKTK